MIHIWFERFSRLSVLSPHTVSRIIVPNLFKLIKSVWAISSDEFRALLIKKLYIERSRKS